MEMQELEITIDGEGRVLVHVNGVSGEGCLAVTRGLEEAVGTVTERSYAPSYYEQPAAVRDNRYVGR